MKKVPFSITVSFVQSKVDGVLTVGKKVASQTRVEEEHADLHGRGPGRGQGLRIDLDEVSGILDIWAKHGESVFRSEDAEETVISELGRKTCC